MSRIWPPSIFLLFFLTTPTFLQGALVNFDWSSVVVDSANTSSPVDALLGIADKKTTTIMEDGFVTVSGFGTGDTSEVSSILFANYFGIPVATVETADFIAFDANPNLVPFESSIFEFTDGISSTSVSIDFFVDDTGGAVLADLAVSDAAIAGIFSGPSSSQGSGVLLFDLAGIDIASPSFQATIRWVDADRAHTPDLYGLATMSSVSAVPEPSHMVGLGLFIGIAVLLSARRKSSKA